jgi:hypothetical protein
MAYKYKDRYIKVGKAWQDDDGFKHPAQWMRWTDAEKKAKGLVWENDPAAIEPFDTKFYWGRNTDGSLIERKLADENRVDDDGNAIINPTTGKQMVELGLKSIWVAQNKRKCTK